MNTGNIALPSHIPRLGARLAQDANASLGTMLRDGFLYHPKQIGSQFGARCLDGKWEIEFSMDFVLLGEFGVCFLGLILVRFG